MGTVGRRRWHVGSTSALSLLSVLIVLASQAAAQHDSWHEKDAGGSVGGVTGGGGGSGSTTKAPDTSSNPVSSQEADQFLKRLQGEEGLRALQELQRQKQQEAEQQFEQNLKNTLGDKGYRQLKEMQAELADAHRIYVTTGKIPETAHHFAPIEVETGAMMTLDKRYEAYLAHLCSRTSAPTVDFQADPTYLTEQELEDERNKRGSSGIRLVETPSGDKWVQDCVVKLDVRSGSTNDYVFRDWDTRESTSGGTFTDGTYVQHHHEEFHQIADPSGLKELLTEYNSGGPLTDFEKKVIVEHGISDLAIISRHGSNVQAYAITTGGSGDRVTTYYDRNGNVLATLHYEKPLVNEGLGFIDYVIPAMAGAKLAVAAGKKIGTRLLTTEVESLAEGEAEAGVTTAGAKTEPELAHPYAKTEPELPYAKTDPAPAGERPVGPGEQTADGSVAPAKGSSGNLPPKEQPLTIKRGDRWYRPYPKKADTQQFTIQTPKGPQTVDGLEYRLRVSQAEDWVSTQQVQSNISKGYMSWEVRDQLLKQAQEMFGLDKYWYINNNPIINTILASGPP